MNNLTATPRSFTGLSARLRFVSVLPVLALLAALLGATMPQAALADVASCKARCEVERAECLLFAKDVLLSEQHRRKVEGIGAGEMKDLFPDLSALSPKKRAAVDMISELGGRYKDRVSGCEMTYRNCTNLDCSAHLLR